ncbi:group II intron reverse transcriptase/maturase [Pseudomonas aeruginosa]|uniref:group II intron reverse transcriptase/maturase n=1 Tax=Pseudomonas aeruginosa TaxID=287 RepID=UPI001BDC1AF4|nr:group II intron reverse transcriptase/maturase [Pseudomonas aeruginosa]MBT1079807.1 group II intron reverse transcriptase/maturase [Pseudomonas aeruginosa]HCE7101334.1 group II intron reverse transcriptase/maturase [Pseudomonas aeruginosa]HCE8175814.1 group II intron reverse transcriptase/maturase [Pseudomonas aeruginosa]HCE8182566.1 group II intron reverse transcriptase/maturase [Pseudomonas aeruginosa]HCE8322846.1 group II intron reverse transcriptase/maturase [Pseudomonas aeruginosa]
MKTQPATPVASASFDGMKNWHDLDWARIQQTVWKTQLKIAQATREGDWRRVKRLQRLLTHSFYGRCLAVRRVTENRGRKTSGVDGETWGTPQAKLQAVGRLSKKRGYRPKPLRRVWIPKPGKPEKRPLGIPTMLDRAMQALYLQALEPVIESTSDPKSYGFRPDRSTADAMVELFHLLSPQTAPVWILEGDIKGFFDNINHEWLCRNVPMDRTVLRKWLKAGVIDRRQLMATEAGTPQGGIISPCLANATLNGLEAQLKCHLVQQMGKTKAQQAKVYVVRYADDFVVTAASKELLEDEVKPWVEQFLSVRGVALSREKTQTVHIHQGFDFLGWNFRKYVPKSPYRKAKLLIKPSKKNVTAFYRKVGEIIKNSGALTQDALIGQLNPVLKGWAQYHSPVVAKQTFSKLDSLIFWRLWRWAKRRHSKKSADWIRKKYFRSIGGQNWVFAYPYKNGKEEKQYRRLYKLAETAIVRHKRLPGEYQPYDAAHELKWEALRVQRMQHKLRYRGQILSIFRRQKGLCALCGHAISKETGWHDHHVIRRVDGGPDTLSNRVLLHPNCHALVHSQHGKVTLRHCGLK